MTTRVLSIVGTRPEAIKMAPLLCGLAEDMRFDSRLCVATTQHEQLDDVLGVFALTPHHELGVPDEGEDEDLFDRTSRALLGLRDVLRAEEPAVVLVHGGTTACLAGALAAFYAGLPIAHVEAGLRSGNLARPFPAEANRVLADRLAGLLFAPTGHARQNLLSEGLPPERIVVTGNTGIDALLAMREIVAGRPAADIDGVPAHVGQRLERAQGPKVLVTGHRSPDFGPTLQRVCDAVEEQARRHADWTFVFPVHPGPDVLGPVGQRFQGMRNVLVTGAYAYAPYVWLLDHCDVILTDSGGIQEEAPALGKPTIVTRTETERLEAVAAGSARLVGSDAAAIAAALEELVGDPAAREAATRAGSLYGDGCASVRIVRELARHFAVEPQAGAA